MSSSKWEFLMRIGLDGDKPEHQALYWQMKVGTLPSSPKDETPLLTKPRSIYHYPLAPGVSGQHTKLIATPHLVCPATSSSSHFIIATPHLTNQLSRTKPSASTPTNYVTGLPSAVNIKKPHLRTLQTNSPKTHSTPPSGPSKNKQASEPFHYTP